MKRTVASLAAVAALLAFSQVPAAAAPVHDKAQVSASDEVSAVRKHRKQRKHVRVYHPGWGWDAPVAWRGIAPDPSFGPYYGYARARASGRCVVDLGYGRYEYCNW